MYVVCSIIKCTQGTWSSTIDPFEKVGFNLMMKCYHDSNSGQRERNRSFSHWAQSLVDRPSVQSYHLMDYGGKPLRQNPVWKAAMHSWPAGDVHS